MKIIWQSKKYFMWFPISFTKYTLTEDRLLFETGLLNNNYDEIYLYKIRDVKLTRNLKQKIFGTGTITLYSADINQTLSVIENIKNSYEIKELLSKMIDDQKKQRLVREYSGSSLNFADINSNGIPDFVE